MQFGSNTTSPDAVANIGRAGRYVLVSVVNVVNHQLILQLALQMWSWSGGWANAFAASVAAIPAYFMSRYWVWEVRGRSSLRGEVLPFWAIALVGLVVSSLMAEAADRLFDNRLMISAGSLLGYFVVWVAKFLLLDLLFGRSRTMTGEQPDTLIGEGVQ